MNSQTSLVSTARSAVDLGRTGNAVRVFAG